MPVNAGLMRERVTILKSLNKTDEYGDTLQEVAEVGTYYCRAENIKNDVVGDTVRQAQDYLKLTTRYKKSLETPDSNMFARFRGRDYDIESVLNPRMLNESLIIECVLKGA